MRRAAPAKVSRSSFDQGTPPSAPRSMSKIAALPQHRKPLRLAGHPRFAEICKATRAYRRKIPLAKERLALRELDRRAAAGDEEARLVAQLIREVLAKVVAKILGPAM